MCFLSNHVVCRWFPLTSGCHDVTSDCHDVTSGLPWRHFRFASIPCWPSGTRTQTRSQTSKNPASRGQVTWAKYGLLIGPNWTCCNLIGYAAYRSLLLLYGIREFCSQCFSPTLLWFIGALHLANSMVNPFVYSFRMKIFKDSLKKCLKQRGETSELRSVSLRVENKPQDLTTHL